jgi:type VI secretion system protein ImpK
VDWGSEDHVLEWDLYKSNLRAEKFYPMAEQAFAAVEQGRSSADPLETYLLCVALGFRGEISYDDEHFYGWVERVYGKVSDSASLAPRPFADEPADSRGAGLAPRGGPGLLLTVSILFAVTAIATLAGYLASFDYVSPL